MSRIAEYAAQAWRILWNNRLRSLLTMLGLIIGVGSVIAILAIGDSTNRSVQNLLAPYSQLSSLISPKEDQPDPELAQIRYSDAQRVARLVPAAQAVQPVLYLPMETRVHHTDKTLFVQSDGAGVGFDSTPLAEGRRFSDLDVAARRHVCIVSDAAKTELFDGGSALGKVVKLQGTDYIVVGVLQPPVGGGLIGGGADVTVTVPYSLIPEIGEQYIYGLAIVAPSASEVSRVSASAIGALKKIHGQRAEYDEQDIGSASDAISKTFAILTAVISVVAGVSLVVGGVGIMNIMLVSVTERTREIGIRKAIGATRGDILLQFFSEALLLCLVGGVIGLAIGAVLAELVIHTLIVKLTGAVVSFSWLPIVAVALGFSAGVGIVFGTYPAVRASYLNPIDALRYE